ETTGKSRNREMPAFVVPDAFGMMESPDTPLFPLLSPKRKPLMSGLTLDPTALNQLRKIKEPVELLDEDGLPLGTFTPVDKKDLYRAIVVPYSDEEILRLKKQEGGRTLAEIIADLEKPRS